jgi:hypothetical protein
MNTHSRALARLGQALIVLGAGPLAAAAFVYENVTELSAGGDFDGNGHTDVVVVDRATGTYRLGYQLSPGAFSWASPRASGVEGVTGFHVGRVLSGSGDVLVFTSPLANRLNVCSAGSLTVPGLPQALFSPGVGPTLVAIIDIGGAGNTALEDFVVASLFNNGLNPLVEALRNTGSGSALQVVSTGNPGGPPRRANRVRLKSGQPEGVAMLVRNGGIDRLQVVQLSTGALVPAIDVPVGPPNELDYVYDFFNSGSPLGQFLFYVPGGNQLVLRPVVEPSPGVFTLGGQVAFAVSKPIYQVFVLTEGTAPRLLVVSGDGATAQVLDFDGSNAPTPGPTFEAAPGQAVTGAMGVAGGGLMLFHGVAGTGSSASFARYAAAGANFTLQDSGALPSIFPLSHRANVMTFRFEPFVDPAPSLLQSLNSGDWTSAYVALPGGQANVTFETFINSSTGLGAAATQTLSPISGSAGFSLVNQYRESISLFRFDPALGSEIAEARIQPNPGTYTTSVPVSFITPDPLTQVYYRAGSAADWSLYLQPFWIFQNTTISFYAVPPAPGNVAKSAIHQASFQFTDAPPDLDSDSDAVPDYVEIANGLDPVNSGSDGDGDGYADLEELTAGTDPANPNSSPAPTTPRPDLHGVVDLIQAPQAVDGVSGAAADAAHGMTLRAFDLTGDLLSVGSTVPIALPEVSGPAALLSNVVVAVDHEIVAVTTEPHFDIVTAQADKRIGRELVRLWDLTAFADPVSLPVTWSGGALAQEAAAWVSAAATRLSGAERIEVAGNVTPQDTLAAVLLEHKVRQILLDRDLSEWGDLTLFPWRSGDAGRSRLVGSDLKSLSRQTADGKPGYRLSDVLGELEAALDAAASSDPVGVLKGLTWEVYRISSASNNPPAGATSWPFFPSPIDTLRGFLVSGVLHSNYLSSSASLNAWAATAFVGAQALLAGVGGRPVVDLNLKVRADTFSGNCVLLDTLDGLQSRALLDAQAAPFEFLDSFTLPVGTIVRVVGYDDVSSLACSALAVEVITAELPSAPPLDALDADGDLLPDGLELALFGSLAQTGFADTDGDGVKNLQELFDGTDPGDAGDKGVAAANFSLPAVQLQWVPSGQLSLQWQWPVSYAAKVQFGVLGTPDLGGPFTQLPAVQSYLGNDIFELSVPDPGAAGFFFQLFMSLK